MLAANNGHLYSLRRYSDHECFYFNAAHRTVPRSITSLKPDLVVFHYTFLVYRHLPEWDRLIGLVGFVRDLQARKVVLASDESWCCDKLLTFIRDFDVSHVFTFSSPQARPFIYGDLDPAKVSLHTVLSGYIDDHAIRRIARRARRHRRRTTDIGCRMTTGSNLGRHGELRGAIMAAFRERAPEHGFRTDISSDYVHFDEWLDFLLDCRYQLGVETGSSILDRDGSVLEFFEAHPDASLEQLEAIRPGTDGSLDYRAMAPRHLEAVMTKTCQVLIEGDYGGVLRPGDHYIEVKRDFSNLGHVLEQMTDEDLRVRIVERAYRDIVTSGAFSYRAFADLVFRESLRGISGDRGATPPGRINLRLLRNQVGDWGFNTSFRNLVIPMLRPLAVFVLGKSTLQRLRSRTRDQ